MNINNNINSAMVGGALGIQRASDGITQNASNLTGLSAFLAPSPDLQAFLENATSNQLETIKPVLPQSSESMTSNLLGLSINLTNAEASTKAVNTASDTVGTILDVLA